MNTDIHSKPSPNQLPEAAKELSQRAVATAENLTDQVEDCAKDTSQTISSRVGAGVERTKEYAQHAVEATKDKANRASDVAKEIYQSSVVKAGDTLETSKEYVRRNPVPVLLGAIAFGAAVGYLVMVARRKPTFGERYAEEPMIAMREALRSAFAPVAQRVHRGYDSAVDGAGQIMDHVHDFGPGRKRESFSHQIGRIGNNLKFW